MRTDWLKGCRTAALIVSVRLIACLRFEGHPRSKPDYAFCGSRPMEDGGGSDSRSTHRSVDVVDTSSFKSASNVHSRRFLAHWSHGALLSHCEDRDKPSPSTTRYKLTFTLRALLGFSTQLDRVPIRERFTYLHRSHARRKRARFTIVPPESPPVSTSTGECVDSGRPSMAISETQR